jgi:hypothetical protein
MKTVVKLDYATFAFEQGSISIPKIEDALAQCDLHFAQTSNASENSPYNSPAGLFYKPNKQGKRHQRKKNQKKEEKKEKKQTDQQQQEHY